jgi:hypothetical protein
MLALLVLTHGVLGKLDVASLFGALGVLVFVGGLGRSQWKRSRDEETAFVGVRIAPDDWPDEKLFFDIVSLVVMGFVIAASVNGIVESLQAASVDGAQRRETDARATLLDRP